MTHHQTLPTNQYEAIQSPYLTKHKTTYSEGDRLIVAHDGHREEKQFKIDRIITEKVNQNYCYLVLTAVNVDDLKDVLNAHS